MLTRSCAALLVTFAIQNTATAGDMKSCTEAGVTLNQVTAMRWFANGSVKLFAIDQEEPAAHPAGIALAIDRGDSLENEESYCRYVGGLASVDLEHAKASYDQAKALLTVEMAARKANEDGSSFLDTTLTLTIDKAAKAEAGLVKADIK